jgi:hypothetical protein
MRAVEVFCRCSADAIVSCGHPLANCQTRFGSQITSAMTPPSHGHRVFRAARCADVTRMPMTRAASRIRIRYSSSMPIPAATPAPSHHRGRSRSSAMAAHTVTTVQASRSYGVVFPTCMAPRKTGANGDRERRDHPRGAAPVEERGEHDDRAAGQRRQDPDSGGVHAEQVSGAGEQHRERRLVHVPEREVVTRHKENTARPAGSRTGR